MPKSKAEMMRKLRKSRKDAGLIQVTYWLTPDEKKKVDKLLCIKKPVDHDSETYK